MAETHRLLRVIEYTGTSEFIRNSINRRSVKGHLDVRDGVIREALIGETAEVLNSFTTSEENDKFGT